MEKDRKYDLAGCEHFWQIVDGETVPNIQLLCAKCLIFKWIKKG